MIEGDRMHTDENLTCTRLRVRTLRLAQRLDALSGQLPRDHRRSLLSSHLKVRLPSIGAWIVWANGISGGDPDELYCAAILRDRTGHSWENPVMAADPLYDKIGRSYASTRRQDARIAALIWDALGPGRSLLNVGAGTGNYEPVDREVVAVDPSPTMIGQRRDRSRLVVQGVAEHLPFPSQAFDAALAVLTVHHWDDREAGLAELRRVSRRQVVFFFEPLETHRFWGLEYFEEARDLPFEKNAPGEELLRSCLNVREIRRALVPANCTDGFGTAFWSRPEAYLEPDVQSGMSWITCLSPAARARGTAELARDLASGDWDRRFGHLRSMDSYDGGYRIAIATG
jgi:SAM-dependent methyltransferase